MTADVTPLRNWAHLPDRADRDWVTSYELIAEAGITYRQCDYWNRTALLHPLDEATPGSGHLRRYDAAQVDRARTLADLLAAGLSLPTCREVIDDLVGGGQVQVGHITLTYDGGAA